MALAIAPACGGSPAAGVRAGTGGGNGGAIGSGGGPSNPGGGGSWITEAGVDALPPFDGGGCIDDTSAEPIGVPATGTFSGEGVEGAVCARGAYAYIQSTPADDGGAPSVDLFVETTVNGSPADALRFSAPANATSGEISVEIGLPAASTGTYTLDGTCGSAVLIANLPPPDPSVCATDAGGGLDCPPGCELTGPLSNQRCTPFAAQLSYVALAAADCVGDSTTPAGAWTLTLTSVTPYPTDAGFEGAVYDSVHGTLSATLADLQGGTAGVALSLTF